MTQEEAMNQATSTVAMMALADPILGAKMLPILIQLQAVIQSDIDGKNDFSLSEYLSDSNNVDIETHAIMGIIASVIVYYHSLAKDSDV